jgi:AcrR family transcriptional regulator
VFVAAGYHAAAMDDIAERAGVSKPVLYQHFPSKLELYVALLDGHVDALVTEVRSAIDSTTDTGSVCTAAPRRTSASSPATARRTGWSSSPTCATSRRCGSGVERALDECVDAIADTIAGDMGVSAAEARLLSVALSGQAEVSARWWLANRDTISQDRAVELLTALAWRGLSRSGRRGGD